ncbi:hypothetical protein K525DRAFT_254746 [Schizophyllum commune Loenen D]|nr:hypothetical protein K525DRAFT_254746 [Schizophyllum commune Loenen D]
MYNVKAPQRRPRRHPYTRMSHDNLRLDGFPHIIPTHQPIPRKTSLDENTIRAPKATAPQSTPEFDEATIKARPPLAARVPVQPEAEDLTVRPAPVHPRGNIALFREVLDRVAREARAEEKERRRAEDLRRQREAEELKRQAEERKRQEEERKRKVAAQDQYNVSWHFIIAGRVHPGSLRVGSFPWPVLLAVRSAEDIRMEDVEEFLFRDEELMVGQERDRLRQEILRWHPDRFNPRILSYIHPSDRALILEVAGCVARILNELKSRMNCPTPSPPHSPTSQRT